MTAPESDANQKQSQSQNVAVEGNFQVGGEGNIVDFSQTHVDLSQAHISQTQVLQVAFDEIKTRPLLPRSPYLGLRKFEVRDKDLFFGRDRLIGHLQNRLQEHFLVVLGASGSGKSSLIRAGLIPKLAQQRGGGWRELIFTPDRDPYESFRASLISAGYRQSATDCLMSDQPDRLIQAIQTIKAPDTEWLIFVDQFEELFTLCPDRETRQTFIDGLMQVVTAGVPSVDMILAMRADFLDRFSAYPALEGILQQSELVTDLGDDELRLAIEQPAAHHGVVFEPGLVGEIIQDLKGRAGGGEVERVSLPLLQYTLKLLWESSGDLSDRILRTSTYRRLGGVRGALQRRVDEIYTSLPTQEQETAKHIFLHLVDTTGTEAGTTAVGKAVSRRAALSDFQTPAERKVLQQLIDANLLISDRPNPHSSAIVELAHETLIDSWDTLKSWIEESKPLIRLRNQLKDDATRWRQLCQQHDPEADAELWQGTKLQRILVNQPEIQSRFGELKPEETAFIEASQALAEQEHRRKIRRLRQAIVGISASLAAVSGFALLAAYQWIRAEQGQIEALSQTSQAEFILNRDTLPPLVTALKAGRRLQRLPIFLRPDDLQAEVMMALAQGGYWVREYNRLAGHTDHVEAVAYSPDGQALASVSYDSTLRLWDIHGNLLKAVPHEVPGLALDFSRDGGILATAGDNGVIKLWRPNGDPITSFQAHDSWIHSLRFNPQLDLLASGGEDGTVKLWTSQGDWKRTIEAHPEPVRDIAISPEGVTLATASADGTVKIWDLYGNPKALPLTGHQDRVRSVQFSQNGQWLVSGGDDGQVRLWTATGIPERVLTAIDNSPVYAVAFSPDDQYITAALKNGLIDVWDKQGHRVATLAGHALAVKSLSFKPAGQDADGQRFASASADGTIKLWQLNYAPRMKILETPGDSASVIGISLSPSGQQVAAARNDSQVALWTLTNPDTPRMQLLEGGIDGESVSFNGAGNQIVSGNSDGHIVRWTSQGQALPTIANAHTDGTYAVSFSPDDAILASGGADRLVKLWEADTGNFIREFSGHEGPINWLSFHPAGHLLASASDDGTVKLWEVQSGQLIGSLDDHTAPVWGVAFDARGETIVTAGADQTVKLWDSNGYLIRTLEGHGDAVNSVRFSYDDQLIFSSSDDQTIKIWRRRDGTLLATLRGHTQGVNSIAVSAPSTLVSGSSDGRVILWNLQEITLTGFMEQGCDWLRDYLRTNDDAPTDLCPNHRLE